MSISQRIVQKMAAGHGGLIPLGLIITGHLLAYALTLSWDDHCEVICISQSIVPKLAADHHGLVG